MNILFNVVWHLAIIESMKATFESWSYYEPPSYHGLHIDLLKQSKVDLSKHIFERMWNSIHKYETTICFNGWDNVVWCPLLNTLSICPNGDVFVGAIDTIGKCKDAQYICNALAKYNDTMKMLKLAKLSK
jgi:hypothetical protein